MTAATVGLIFTGLFIWETQDSGVSALLVALLVVRAGAVVAAARGWLVLMFVLVFISFIPIGRYFLGSPEPRIALIGVSDLIYFFAAVALVVLPRSPGVSAPADDEVK